MLWSLVLAPGEASTHCLSTSRKSQEQHQYQSLVLLADALVAVASRLSLPYRHHTHLLDLFYHTTIQTQKVSVPSMTYFDKR